MDKTAILSGSRDADCAAERMVGNPENWPETSFADICSRVGIRRCSTSLQAVPSYLLTDRIGRMCR